MIVDHVKKEKCYLYAYHIVDVLTTLVSSQAEGIALSLLLSISYLLDFLPQNPNSQVIFCFGGNILQTLPAWGEARRCKGRKKSLAHPKLFVQK